MRKHLLTMLANLGLASVLPRSVRFWLISWQKFSDLPAERQRQLRSWSRAELMADLLVHKLDPATGWVRHVTAGHIEQHLRRQSRMSLLEEAGYLLPDPLPCPSVGSGGSS